MRELRGIQSIAASALEFLILTCTRTAEVLTASWSDINLADGLWIIPADKTKTDREHRVCLSKQAIRVLEAMRKISTGDRIFVVGDHAPLRLAQRLRPDITGHGFRSAFKDWAHERTNYPREAIELALGHTVGDTVEQAYRRGDMLEKRRRLSQGWGDFCDKVQPVASVTPIRAEA